MLIRPSRQKGVSLIEIMVGIAVIGILLWVGIPSFKLWMQNTQNRSAAESILDGLQTARAEAVKHNANVRLNLTDTSGRASWTVGCVTPTAECPATIQSKDAAEGTANARVGIDTATPPTPLTANYYGTALSAGAGLPAGITFDGMGRVPTVNVGTDITRVDVTNTLESGARRYVVIIGSGGIIRMCDPLLSMTANPQGCQ